MKTHASASRLGFTLSRAQGALCCGSIALVLLAGCPGRLGGTWPTGDAGVNSGSGGAPVEPAYCDAPALLFKNTSLTGGCGLAGACHDATGANSISGINLVDEDVWMRLLNRPSTKALGTACAGMMFVNPTKPPSGILIKRVSEPTPCGPNSLMPLGLTAPDQEIVSCIAGWVNAQLSP